jgi:23S rRNA (adenine2503-C2)-methyltransferase
MSESSTPILSLTSDAFIDRAREIGIKPGHALEIYRRVFREGVVDVEWVSMPSMPVAQEQREGETTKFTQQIEAVEPPLETESVILPQHSRTGRVRNTLCVSSQIGCAMGCEFCETAQMGLMKNLSIEEIIAQWFAARFHFGTRISNIVFMGMGEPMDNIDNVIGAIRVLCDHNGPGLAASKIAVSTVGRAEGIHRLRKLASEPGFHRLQLAVSINASNDEVRSRIMPINRKTNMAALREAMAAWPMSNTRRLLVEYVIIPGVNDKLEHAAELAAFLRGMYCTVNVIPYNPRRDSPWPAPPEESVNAFLNELIRHGQFVTRRRTMGRSLMAACGQLGSPAVRKRKFIELGSST